MQDIHTRLRALRRPRILIDAARKGMREFRRERHLKRLLIRPSLPSPAESVMILLELEAEQNAKRKAGDASYTPLRHLDLMIALLAEANALGA